MADGRWPSEEAGHDATVPYRDEIVSGDAIDVQRWESWSHKDASIVHYYAKGPCPACQAETQGHFADIPTPLTRQGRRKVPCLAPAKTDSDKVEIPLRCVCGTDHGHAGAAGCGRHWSVTVRRVAS